MFSGFARSPVTKGIIVATVVSSGLLHLRDPEGKLNVTLDIWRVFTERELWRLVTCHTVCTGMGPLLATSLSLYRMRALEPLLGSRKFGAFAVVTGVLALPFEATAGVYFETVRLTPGPLPLVFALLVMYYAVVPPLNRKQFGLLGMDFSNKAFTFCVAGMLAFCEGWNSVVPAVCGAMVGGVYLMDTMSVQSVRLPNLIYRCCSKLCRPLLGVPRRPVNGGPPASARSATRRPRPATQPSHMGGLGAGGGGIMSFLTPRQLQNAPRLRYSSLPQQLLPPSEETISVLTSMGFDRSAVTQALQHTGNDTSAAANILLSGAGAGGRGSPMGVGDAAGPGAGVSSARPPPAGAGGSSGSPPGTQHDHAN